MGSCAVLAAVPVSPRRHVTSCATPVFTRLREAGMSIEALQAQAGHASIETTRVYLHLTNDWLAGEYREAQKRIDADRLAVTRCAPSLPSPARPSGPRCRRVGM